MGRQVCSFIHSFTSPSTSSAHLSQWHILRLPIDCCQQPHEPSGITSFLSQKPLFFTCMFPLLLSVSHWTTPKRQEQQMHPSMSIGVKINNAYPNQNSNGGEGNTIHHTKDLSAKQRVPGLKRGKRQLSERLASRFA